MGFALGQIQILHQCGETQIDAAVLLVRRQLPKLVVVVQRRHLDLRLRQPMPSIGNNTRFSMATSNSR